jgi:hypothetical protein
MAQCGNVLTTEALQWVSKLPEWQEEAVPQPKILWNNRSQISPVLPDMA